MSKLSKNILETMGYLCDNNVDIMKIINLNISKKGYLVFLALLAIFSLIYFSQITSYYLHHDDYHLFTWNHGKWSEHPQYWPFILWGRPVGISIILMEESLVRTVNEMNFVRFINIVVLSLLAFIMYRWFRENSVKSINAFLLAVAICSLPPFQIFIAWLTPAHTLFAILLSTYAAILVSKVAYGHFERKKSRVYYIMGICLLLLAAATHQMGTMFYWVILSISMLNINNQIWSLWKRSLILSLSAFFIATGIYFVLYKIIYLPLLLPIISRYIWIDPNSRSTLISSVSEVIRKIFWFFDEPMTNALNLWNIFPRNDIAIIVTVIIIAGFIIEFIKCYMIKESSFKKELLIRNNIQKSITILTLIPLSHLPMLIIKENNPLYHTLSAITVVLFILFYRGLYQIVNVLPLYKERIFTSILIVITAIGAIIANNNVTNYFAVPCSLEIKYVKDVLNKNDITNLTRIHVIRPHESVFWSKGHRYDSFGIPSSYHNNDIIGIIKCALIELGFPHNTVERAKTNMREFGMIMDGLGTTKDEILVTSAANDKNIPLEKKTLVIDMTKLNEKIKQLN